MSFNKYDCIVIGSGAAGVHAAFPLVEKGFNVLMLDGGIVSKEDFKLSAILHFDSIRKKLENQHELFLGKDLSGAIPHAEKYQSTHMSSGRFSYINEKTNDFLPVSTNGFLFTRTLAKGGLTEVWGGATDVLDRDELEALGLPSLEIEKEYQTIIDRVGVAGDINGYLTQKPAKVSTHSRNILEKYKNKINFFKDKGFTLRESILTLLTEDKGDRKSSLYSDSDYWDETRRSLYKAKFTLEDLQKKNNFHYVPNRVAISIKESEAGVTIQTIDFSNVPHEYEGKYVIVCAGALNTVKILLKTFDIYNKKVQIITKPNIITPCIDLKFLGKTEDTEKHSLCQLVLENDNKVQGLGSSYSQIYKYKSLLLFKLLNFFPFTRPESFSLLSLLIPSMFIVDSRFPTKAHHYKTCELNRRNGRDELVISYSTSNEELSLVRREIKKINKCLWKLGLIPLKNVYMENGATAHYAGGISSETDLDAPLRADINGRINNSKRIFAGDASLWKALSAKPPTLTIMANANRIGLKVGEELTQN